MDNFFDNQRILQLIWKRKFHFVLVGVIAVVLSAVFSGPAFITPKFKSTARIYPTNIWTMSDESETEQMLEILNSNDIKFRMFDSFDLASAYKINKEDPQYRTYMLAEYNTNVSTSKTEYETAEIKVMDEDPQRASDMCDSIISFYNQKVREIHKAKDKEMIDITGRQLDKKYAELDVLEHELDSIREKYGIISYGQVDEITRGYMNALAAGRGAAGDTKKIEKLYDNFSKEGSRAYRLEDKYNRAVQAIDSLSMLHELHIVEFEKEITYSHVVEYPFPADKKAYPVRWLIVAFTTLSAVFFALLVFLVLDYGKKD
ncbi:Wzz/FepE/Etk N-terminal domain-containing protein [Draconibacterium sp. IB214405]|uniref:Wzz/FepE/Etk N-terminal domain-containing protein n=1 Tax=Draconibacterium sp. IB214405 TaxID=3097352 RepID=UPI002A10467D|nr:Wzz/FepE/Etk N-terminal domain-containing protein [Draconibacterium sp. IB214405]MDX8341725.1 Wzz/FepE/Etk N-terminal domain-containing protein [Draconibacterium sp. IB214405]